MSFQPGDRVRCVEDHDGMPLVRYGSVSTVATEHGPVTVMFDDALGGDIVDLVDLGDLEQIAIDTIVLRLDGDDLLHDPALRSGLVALWEGEADRAGLAFEGIHRLGHGLVATSDSWALAELVVAGSSWVLVARTDPASPGTVVVGAARPNRWDT